MLCVMPEVFSCMIIKVTCFYSYSENENEKQKTMRKNAQYNFHNFLSKGNIEYFRTCTMRIVAFLCLPNNPFQTKRMPKALKCHCK